MNECEWGCANGCTTYGQHIRSKGIGYNGCFPTRSNGAGRSDGTLQKKWDKELDRYEDARRQGIQPAGTTMDKIVDAEKQSDRIGQAYDASDPYKHVNVDNLIG